MNDKRRVDYRPFPKLTASFVAAHLQLGWRALAWAAENHWLDGELLAELGQQAAADDEDVAVALARAAIDHDDQALRMVLEQQAESEASTDDEVRARWLRVAVAWVYEHREDYDDPLAVIEEIWEAFGHPTSLNGLIRWMPVSPGDEAGEDAMMKRWRAIVEDALE